LAKPNLKAVAGASAATLLLAFVPLWEGLKTDPYADLIGKMTVCVGETNVPMRRYSKDECMEMLDGSLAGYASAVLKRNPELAGHPNQLAAATAFSYNVGVAAYNRSSVARLFSAGKWPQACDALLKWNRAGGKVVRGLSRRREAERQMCRKGLA
jgi:lysozyme